MNRKDSAAPTADIARETTRPRLLHVDDNEDFTEMFQLFFFERFSVSSAVSGKNALELLQKQQFDALITDFDLPDINGLQLLEQVNSSFPHIPVIFYTGQGNEEIARTAFLAGAADYFVKRIDEFIHKEKLENSILQAIQRKKAEQAHRNSEEKFRELFLNVSDALIILEHEPETNRYRISEINTTACSILSRTREELLTLAPDNVFTKDFLEELTRGNHPPESRLNPLIESVLITREGKRIPVDIKYRYLETGKNTFILISFPNPSNNRKSANRICRMNQLVKSINIANQVMMHETDQLNLIDRTCKSLVQSGAFLHAWILLTDKEDQFISARFSRTDGPFEPLLRDMKKNQFPHCIRRIRLAPENQVFRGTQICCSSCPPSCLEKNEYFITRLEYEGKMFGYIHVTVPAEVTVEEEEENLFQELARDIAQALNTRCIKEDYSKTLKALVIEQEKLQHYIDTIDAVVVTLNKHQKITRINKKALEVLGVASEEDVLGNSWFDIFTDSKSQIQERQRFKKMLKDSDKKQNNIKNTYTTKADTGSSREISWTSSVTRNKQGSIQSIIMSGVPGRTQETDFKPRDIISRFLPTSKLHGSRVIQEKDTFLFLEPYTLPCETTW